MGGAIDNGARVIANGAGDASKRAAGVLLRSSEAQAKLVVQLRSWRLTTHRPLDLRGQRR